MKRFVGEREISQMTGIAVQTLRNWRHTRQGFPYAKLGKSIRYDANEVIAYMESKKIRPEELQNAG